MKEYKLIRADNSIDSKKGNMNICYKKFLSVRSVQIKNLDECVTFEVYEKQKRVLTLQMARSNAGLI